MLSHIQMWRQQDTGRHRRCSQLVLTNGCHLAGLILSSLGMHPQGMFSHIVEYIDGSNALVTKYILSIQVIFNLKLQLPNG